MSCRVIIIIIFALSCFTAILAQPRLDNHGDWARITVNDKPMLIIGGEMGNSSASTVEDIEQIFPYLSKLGLNTVLAPVSWELIEAKEGEYDFSLVDSIVGTARKNNLKVILLWFGVWKNSMSCYTPEWFKRDSKRFPRASTAEGRQVEEASSISSNVLEADKRVFCKLLQHIKDIDGKEQTIIMIQVENEIGMIDSPRDYSAASTTAYNLWLKDNPSEELKVKSYSSESDREVYLSERFQAFTYAKYVEEIARAGKKIYNLPMFVNVALNSRNRKPGQYPSGGPLAHLADIWKKYAPSIDVMALDLYDNGFESWTAKYHMNNNPLFIPEIRLEDNDAARAFYAFGHHHAMGFSPFSIEDYPLYRNSAATSGFSAEDLTKDDQLNNFSSRGRKSSSGTLSPLSAAYHLLQQAEPLILQYHGSKDMEGFLLSNEKKEAEWVSRDNIKFTVRHSYTLGWEPGSKSSLWDEAGCIIIRLSKEDYLVIGTGVVITFQSASNIGLAKCEQVEIQRDSTQRISYHVIRHLSGDQTHQGRHIRIPMGEYQIQHFRIYDF